jgi:cephalosporin hydroxylase
MQIAQQLMPNGMAAHNDFKDAITYLIKTEKLQRIIETGSYLGEGTTQAIADALVGHEQVFSIEVNPRHYEIARKRHRNTPINFMLGLSVGRSDVPTSISFDVPDNIVIDHLDHNRELLYRQEISFKGADNLLNLALSKLDYKPDLVILDSAGHMGLQEFKYLMNLVEPGFYLALDDTNHVKHYDTCKSLETVDCELVFQTEQGFGSRIYYIK